MRLSLVACTLAVGFSNIMSGLVVSASEPPVTFTSIVKQALGGAEDNSDVSGEVLKPTHKLNKKISVGSIGNISPQSITLLTNGNLACLMTTARYASVGDGQSENQKVAKVILFDPNGEELRRFDLDFMAETISAGPNGEVITAGAGKFARYQGDGEKIASIEIPFIIERLGNEEALREGAIARIDQMNNSYKGLVDSFRTQAETRKEAVEKAKTELTEAQATLKDLQDGKGTIPEESSVEKETKKATLSVTKAERKVEIAQRNFEMIEENLKVYKDIIKEKTPENIAEAVNEIKSTMTKIHCVSQRGDDIFLILSEEKGYGYALWKSDVTLAAGSKCKEGLRGCCGQYHLQACEDGLYCAENTNYRVAKYAEDGELVSSFGEKGRDEDGGFTGCCNPMNVYIAPSGEIYSAESSGDVKTYTEEGKVKSLLVREASLKGGCRNMSFAVNEDLKRVYMCDVTNNAILIFEQNTETPVAQMN